MKHQIAGLMLGLLALPAAAAVQTQSIEYDVGSTTHVGYLAYDDSDDTARPGVLVIPEWWGLNDYAKQRARELAAAGYVAFAADMYGEGKTTQSPQEAKSWSTAAKANLRGLGQAALSQLAEAPRVDDAHLGAIGFCFGGTSALELAYSGAPVDAVVSLHGHLPPPATSDDVNAAILVLHGAADPMVKMSDVTQLAKTLDARENVDWHLTMYGDAEHAFTNPAADDYGIDGVSYNAVAAKRAWAHTQTFLADKLAGGETGTAGPSDQPDD
ncbi:dienelactone hydrolase family protein [Salinisphaera sp.]|uniref:dienelactone hydrolase family protein n=1 Tax=Salinisphaera sp. TaxID=1914330 RepID=UPI000C55819F|nr:dienelactone hydrolase family protein [Salinisphaera sp.]MAS09519.1 dienelactone hydrolase [Salinisphaera sp.]|tara:strand:- start:1292 stop:2101 length:810 start_codon:yes stop_codon:yes gene_type:complete